MAVCFEGLQGAFAASSASAGTWPPFLALLFVVVGVRMLPVHAHSFEPQMDPHGAQARQSRPPTKQPFSGGTMCVAVAKGWCMCVAASSSRSHRLYIGLSFGLLELSFLLLVLFACSHMVHKHKCTPQDMFCMVPCVWLFLRVCVGALLFCCPPLQVVHRALLWPAGAFLPAAGAVCVQSHGAQARQ